MKTKAIKSKKTDNWALPGDPITLADFKAGIKKAEEGPFFTIEESKKMLEAWRNERNSR